MPLSWSPTVKKRLLLAGIGLISIIARPFARWRRQHASRNDAVQSILVVELWNIGDVILSLPFLTKLRTLFPTARITLVAQPHAEELLEGSGVVDEVVTTDLAWDEARPGRRSRLEDAREFLRITRKLRERRFDLAFQARLHVREHALIMLSGARRRVGYAFGGPASGLTDALPPDDRLGHKVGDWMRLLEPFGGGTAAPAPRLGVSELERTWAKSFLAANGILPTDTVIGIHPGASVPEKRWPLDKFERITSDLSKRRAVRVLAFVDPGGYGTGLGEIPRVAAAKVGLRHLIALIERCKLIVCNDSGPMHIAGALQVPTVAIFGSQVVDWFAPLGSGHEIVTASSNSQVKAASKAGNVAYGVAEISTDAVLKAIDRALGRIAAGAPESSTG